MAGYIKFDGIANQNPQNLRREMVGPTSSQARMDGAGASERDLHDTLSLSGSHEAAAVDPDVAQGVDGSSPKLMSPALEGDPDRPGGLDIRA